MPDHPFPELKSQEEIDADASYSLFSWVVETTSKVRKSLRSFWQ
jgi:hypothetical protein